MNRLKELKTLKAKAEELQLENREILRKYTLTESKEKCAESNARFKANGYKVAEAEFGWYNPRRYVVMNQARRFGNICQLFGWGAWTTDCICAVCRKHRENEVKEAKKNA